MLIELDFNSLQHLHWKSESKKNHLYSYKAEAATHLLKQNQSFSAGNATLTEPTM